MSARVRMLALAVVLFSGDHAQRVKGDLVGVVFFLCQHKEPMIFLQGSTILRV